MIIRKDQAPVDRGTAEDEQTYGARESLHLTVRGRPSSSRTSRRCNRGRASRSALRHEEKPRASHMLSGEATVIEEDGPHTSTPATRPAGSAARRTPTRS